VRHLGIDEHRFRSVRWFKDEAGAWRRIEPWMTTLVDLATGEVIDVVDGRDAAAVADWLAAQPRWWRRRVEVVGSTPPLRFAPLSAAGCPRPASRSTTSTWSGPATTCSPPFVAA